MSKTLLLIYEFRTKVHTLLDVKLAFGSVLQNDAMHYYITGKKPSVLFNELSLSYVCYTQVAKILRHETQETI